MCIWRFLLPATLLIGGCAIVGPASISNGRLVYTEVINYTGDQQVLNMIVRDRYAQTFGMLTVASVTATVRFRANAGAEFRAGASASSVDSNLVPLSAGVAYEENPTISYIPLQGEAFMRRMLMPITLEQAFLVRAAATGKFVGRELYLSTNGVQNPVGGPPSPEFQRLEDIHAELELAGAIYYGRAPAPAPGEAEYYVSLHDYGVEHTDDVQAYLEILGIEGQTVDGRDIVIPIYLAPGKREDAINVLTRTALDWIRHAGSMIDVPAAHLDEGIVEPSDWEQGKERFITIHSSKKRPKNAVVEVAFRGWWYYIDASDMRSKRSFQLIKFLIGLRLDEKGTEQQIPILTVPVG